MRKAKDWIEKLELLPHPEGGYYKETYRSNSKIEGNLEETFPAGRSHATGIYYLLEQGDFSAFHRIKSDEMWHFYDGEPLEVFYFKNKLHRIVMGRDIAEGQVLQAVVPANCWFASRPVGAYALVGCTVAPGFHFEDFEMAQKASLIAEFPRNEKIISELSR